MEDPMIGRSFGGIRACTSYPRIRRDRLSGVSATPSAVAVPAAGNGGGRTLASTCRWRVHFPPRSRPQHRANASTFSTLQAADEVVSAALKHNSVLIASWLKGSNKKLTIRYKSPGVTGKSLKPGAKTLTDVHGVLVVLTRDPSMPCKYHIVTGYPE